MSSKAGVPFVGGSRCKAVTYNHKVMSFRCACSGSGQGSSKAGFPWWAGLIIALVALAVIAGLAGLACLGRARRRRRKGSALEEAIHKQVPALLSLTPDCICAVHALHRCGSVMSVRRPEQLASSQGRRDSSKGNLL